MREVGELVFLGITIDEEYGGLGMGFTSSVLVTDYFSGATGSMATAYGAHTGIGTLPIALYGNEKQKEKYLPKLSTGRSEEHTSELQSRGHLVCRLLLEHK